MNLADMRTIVRRELKDEDADNYRWTNDEMDRHIARAVKEFSEAIPYEQKVTKATTANSRELDISSLSDRVMVAVVEYPVGEFPMRYQRFSLWGDTLTLLGSDVPDGSNACIYYGKLHTLAVSSSTIPAEFEELVALGAGGYAAYEWAAYATNRVNAGGSDTTGEFLKWGRDKLEQFRAALRRLGRRNRVRAGSLYRPYYPAVSQTTDYGP